MVLNLVVSNNIPNNLWGRSEKAVSIAIQNIAFAVRRRATQNAPYLTGTLRRSIVEVVKKDRAIVWSNVAYAKKREFVNRKNPHTRFYMRRAKEDTQREVWDILKKAFISAMR